MPLDPGLPSRLCTHLSPPLPHYACPAALEPVVFLVLERRGLGLRRPWLLNTPRVLCTELGSDLRHPEVSSVILLLGAAGQ